MHSNLFSSTEENKQKNNTRKKWFLIIIGTIAIILPILISMYLQQKSYEDEYISRAKALALTYNLKDANIHIKYKGKSYGHRQYSLVVNSPEFQNLVDHKKYDFIKALDDIWVYGTDYLIYSSVVSNKDKYEIGSNENILEKNGSKYYFTMSQNNETYSTSGHVLSEEPNNEYVSPREPSSEDKGFVWAAAIDTVEERLKAPSTADFPFSYNGQDIKEIGYNRFVVNSYVDAENSFGAKIRTYFSVTIRKTSENTYVVENFNSFN